MGSKGQNLKCATNHPAVDKVSSWLLDGQLLAFSSDRSGNFDI